MSSTNQNSVLSRASFINQSEFSTNQSSRSRSVSSTNQNSLQPRAQETGQCHQPIRINHHPQLKKQVMQCPQPIIILNNPQLKNRSVSSTNQNSVQPTAQEASQCHQPIRIQYNPQLIKQVNVINQSEFSTTHSSRSRPVSSTNQNSFSTKVKKVGDNHQPIRI